MCADFEYASSPSPSPGSPSASRHALSPPLRKPPSPPVHFASPIKPASARSPHQLSSQRRSSEALELRKLLLPLVPRWGLDQLDRVVDESRFELVMQHRALPLGLLLVVGGFARTEQGSVVQPGHLFFHGAMDPCTASTPMDIVVLPPDPLDLVPIRVLGKGKFGQVHLLRCRANGLLLAKKAPLDPMDSTQANILKREGAVLAALRGSPFVTAYYGPMADNALLLEFLGGGQLLSLLEMRGALLSRAAQQFYLATIASALAHVHARHVIYRDLKPENCMVDQLGYLRLVDFGMAKHLGAQDFTTTICGTPDYFSPELARGDAYSYPTDCWALGCIFFEIVAGFSPFASSSIIGDALLSSSVSARDVVVVDAELMARICDDPVAFPEDWDDDVLANLCMDLLDKEPAQRPSAARVKQHPCVVSRVTH